MKNKFRVPGSGFRVGCLAVIAAVWVFTAAAADRITATVTVTNGPTTNAMTFVITTTSASTRTWTNSVFTPATQILTNATANGSATNLQNHLQASPPAGVVPTQTDSNVIVLAAQTGLPLTITGVGSYFSVTYATQSVTAAFTVRVPYTVEPAATRTQIVAGLVAAIESPEQTNSLNQNSLAASELAGLTNAQTITGVKDFSSPSGIYRGSVSNSPGIGGNVWRLTNGVYKTPILDAPTATNGVNYGNAFSSPGTNLLSEQFGASALAIADAALAVGPQAIAAGESSAAFGVTATATLPSATAIGNSSVAAGFASSAFGASALATNDYTTAVGAAATASAENATALGENAVAGFTNSTAIGANASTTKTNQIRLGSADGEVSAPGNLVVNGNLVVTNGARIIGALTNLTAAGTNNFPSGSDLAFGRYANSALANGNNAAVLVGTNVFVEVSGPSAGFTINGLNGGPNRDGKLIVLLNQSGQVMTIANESGVDPTAGNRIRTLTGADVVTTANSVCLLIYSGSASRWILLSARP